VKAVEQQAVLFDGARHGAASDLDAVRQELRAILQLLK
jgi:hypothetical protein